MNRKSLLFALAICGLLVLAGIWQLNTPAHQSKVHKPSDIEARLDEDAGQPLAADPGRAPLDEPAPQPKKLAPPPPAPPVENDPAKGRVWLRLLDSRTNRPVAETNCELIRMLLNDYSWELSRIAGRRQTDTDGLVGLTAGFVDIENGSDGSAWDVSLFTGGFDWFTVPVPERWLPVSNVNDIAKRMQVLCSAPSTEPIDIIVAPEATLRIVARDEWGQPLPDAQIEYFTIAYADSAAGWLELYETLPPFQDEHDWTSWVIDRREERALSGVEAVFDGKPAPEAPSGPTIEFPGIESEPAPSGVVFRGLPCVRIGAVGYQTGLGFGESTIDLAPGANELNVYLRPVATCTLNVRIEYHGEAPGPDEAPQLSLQTTGPLGDDDAIHRTGSPFFTWQLSPTGRTVWQGQVRNLPPGCWQAQAEFWDGGEGHARVCLQAGEAAAITLYCGEAALAYWTPIIRLGGKQLEESSIRLLGGEEQDEPEAETVSCDSATGETTELELQAGTYTVWIPTLQPVQVSLLPGEKRSDVFELLCATVRFSIDAPLAELLSFEGADVQLNLYPADDWDTADEHLASIDGDLRASDAAYDQLNPGVVRIWTVPLGRYSWHLIGADQEIQGSIELMTAGSTSVRFGLHNMPGYELCEIEFSGFADGEAPDFKFSDDGTAEMAINAFRADLDSSADFTTTIWSRLPDRNEVQALRSADGNIVFAFAPAGGAQLTVQALPAYYDFRANFPGRLIVRPSQLGGTVTGRLLLQGGEDDVAADVDWEVSAFHEDGCYAQCIDAYELEMAVGWVTLVVSRQTGITYESARVQVKLTAEPQTLDLNSLSYERFAEVTFIFKGRGSPESPFDAWWYGDAEPAPLLLALDQSFGGTPRYVGLGEPDRVMPDGRLEFCFERRMLPPGRYKVIPWAGAPEKYCKTFTLAPGETSSVVVQGG